MLTRNDSVQYLLYELVTKIPFLNGTYFTEFNGIPCIFFCFGKKLNFNQKHTLNLCINKNGQINIFYKISQDWP